MKNTTWFLYALVSDISWDNAYHSLVQKEFPGKEFLGLIGAKPMKGLWSKNPCSYDPCVWRLQEEREIPGPAGSAELRKPQVLNQNDTFLSAKEFTYSNFILSSLVLNLGRARPSWPRKTLHAFTWEKITSTLSYNQAASIYWVMIACQQRAVTTLWCSEIDMQSREIDLGVIYILVREEVL